PVAHGRRPLQIHENTLHRDDVGNRREDGKGVDQGSEGSSVYSPRGSRFDRIEEESRAMTTKNNRQQTRDEELFAFHEACKRPTAAQILEWPTRYPEFADDLRAHAAIARDWAARQEEPVVEPDETMLSRGHSRVLNAIHNAEAAAAAVETPAQPCLSFK